MISDIHFGSTSDAQCCGWPFEVTMPEIFKSNRDYLKNLIVMKNTKLKIHDIPRLLAYHHSVYITLCMTVGHEKITGNVGAEFTNNQSET